MEYSKKKYEKYGSLYIISLFLIFILACGVQGIMPDCETDKDCDDGSYCNGIETCQCSMCVSGKNIDCSYLDDQCNIGICDEVNDQCYADSSYYDGYSCDDGLFCNEGETCQNAECAGGSGLICNTPPGPMQCYSLGLCNEETDTCDYEKLLDETGPVTYDLDVVSWFNAGVFDISATIEDECTEIQVAEFFLGFIGTAECGGEGNGDPIYPADDGSFDIDKLIEDLLAEDVTYTEHDGVNWVCVRGKDNENNWGDCECLYYQSDLIIPEEPMDIRINDELIDPNNITEELVCEDNFEIKAKVCDSQSDIQGGEYFIDITIPPLPAPWTGGWMNPTDSWIEGVYHCADISGTVNLTPLSEGTHYLVLRGKDNKEWWGKMLEYEVPFIKDSTPPNTTKEITPYQEIIVQCDIDEINGKTITDGCHYVKPGTKITLSSYDFNPDDDTNNGYNDLDGEYADSVIINYIVWWSYDGTSWEIKDQGQSNINDPIEFTLQDDSYHLIEYWAEDLCGNEEKHHFELDIIDTVPPVTTKEIIGPVFFNESENKTYIDGITKINLTCIDPEPHPVNDVTIYYRYYVDDKLEQNWTTYKGPFSFPEESKHELEYYCVDALGNEEEHQFEIDYVDHTPPTTTKTYGDPFYTDGISKWINSSTLITLTADDGDSNHSSGLNAIYWRNTIVDDEYCSGDWDCYDANGREDFNIYTEPFNKPKESCHLIEYYSVDNVNKTETIKKQCVYVDNTPPTIEKKLIGPMHDCTKDEWLSYGEPDYGCHYITNQTRITLNCTDKGDHPVNNVTLYYRDYLINETAPGFTTVQGGYADIQKKEDSEHILEFYCIDALGNTDGPHTEIDIVDSQKPKIWKDVGEPSILVDPGCNPETEACDYYITQDTEITLHCVDLDPHPVGDVTIHYIWTDPVAEIYDIGSISSENYTFTYPADSEHWLYFWCEDALGNTAGSNSTIYEIDYVDTVPPDIIKTVGEPKVPYDNPGQCGDDYYVTQDTEITLTCTDPQPHPVDDVIIQYRYRLKENFSDTWGAWNNWVEVHDNQTVFSFTEDSIHELEYRCNDSLGNEYEPKTEIDIVDTVPPVTTKEIIGPVFFDKLENKTYINGVTKINLTCIDPEPHPVNDVTIYYRYYVNGLLEQNWTTYKEPFGFPEESKHELEYYCVDALGNEEEHQFEIDYVDHTPPNTTKTYGVPFYTDGISKWINSSTLITLTADDGDSIHSSGVNTIYWRNTIVDESFCAREGECGEAQGSGDFNIYTDPFNKPNESCHLIEYYSVDNVNKTETIKKQCVYVDNTPPTTEKSVGDPKISCENQTDCHWWITQDTTITLDCEDKDQPHPVDNVTLYWRYYRDNETVPDFTPVQEGYAEIQNTEDCRHILEWYCEDALGNRDGIHTEIDNVDTAPPIIKKYVRVDRGEGYEPGIYSVEGEVIQIGIRSEDKVLFCAEVEDIKQTNDSGIGVDSVWARFSLYDDPELIWDDTENAYCIEKEAADFDCGIWHYEVKANDSIGNEAEWTDGIQVLIDNVPPLGKVLNPHAGNSYYAGKIFPFYAPAVDFGGDNCSFGCGEGQDCPASGVDYCDVYATDYDFEGMNQSEIKNCYQDLKKYLMQVGADPYMEYIGRVPYEDGVCKGYLQILEETNLTDTVFMAVDWVDKAGNSRFGLALNPWFSPITMNLEEKGYIEITEMFSYPVTSNDLLEVKAELHESGLSGTKECIGTIEKYNEGDGLTFVTSYDGEVTGNAIAGYECVISDSLPDYSEINSGDYKFTVEYRLNDDWQVEVIGSDWFDFIVDNTRPTMGIISPLQGSVFGEVMPVSLHIEDSQSPIADETVQVRIHELGSAGNLWCLFGCEDTGWLHLSEVHDGLYAGTINTTEHGLSGNGKYNFDAIACDDLYVADADPDNPLGIDINEDRNTRHCKMISAHGAQEESRPECNDGLDNDLDGEIDYPNDPGCEDDGDDNETDPVPFCGDGEVNQGVEECDDGNNDDGDGCSSTCMIEIPAGPDCVPKTYTVDLDFDEGSLIGLEHETVNDQLQVELAKVSTFPTLWVANSGDPSLSKWDTQTNKELARYQTFFGTLGSFGSHNGPAPSRTAVDIDGNVYVANRQFPSNKPADVIKILANDYIDRNGNSVMDTSYDANDDGVISPSEMMPLIDNNSNGVIDDEEIVDERIAWVVEVGPDNCLGRSLAIDLNGDIWLGCYNSQEYYKIDGDDGSLLAGPIDVSPNTPYGALVDKDGILWGSSLTTNMLRLDTNTHNVTVYYHGEYGGNYGIALGYDDNDDTQVYLGSWGGNTYIQFNSSSEAFSTPAALKYTVRGIATDQNGNIIAGSGGGVVLSGAVAKFAPDGSLIWQASRQVTGEARGSVVDSNGDVWLVHVSNHKLSKFNGTDGSALGTRPTGRSPYTYSDATGLGLMGSTSAGKWNVAYDSGIINNSWAALSWNSYVPGNTSLDVKARSSDDASVWSSWETASNGVNLSSTPDGQYLEIEVSMQIMAGDVSPILYDLTVECDNNSI